MLDTELQHDSSICRYLNFWNTSTQDYYQVVVYPKEISEWLNVSSSGRISADESNGNGRAANFECGCVVRFAIGTDPDGTVGIGCETNGCGYMRAAAAIVGECVGGRSILDLGGLAETDLSTRAEKVLGAFPVGRRACLEAAINAVREGFADHRRKRIEGSGDKALICTCFGISEDRIQEVITADPSCKAEDIKGATNAGRGCGSCLMLIEEMLEQAKAAEMEY